VNGLLADALYPLLKDIKALAEAPSLVKAAICGISYLAIVRLKFTTFSVQGKETPFGIEALYEGSKTFVYKRINRIALEARYTETVDMAKSMPLDQLTARAKLAINQNAILTADEKRGAMIWLLGIMQDQATNEFDKSCTLADYVLSGQRIGNRIERQSFTAHEAASLASRRRSLTKRLWREKPRPGPNVSRRSRHCTHECVRHGCLW
jgi:hypothetical protein